MEDTGLLQTLTDKRLNREDELLQSFVRINLEPSETDDKSEIVQKADVEGVEKDDKSKLTLPAIQMDQTGRVSRISLDSRRRGRRRRKDEHRHEELYTDKDRAAAVNMGTKDIKQSLKLKRKLDRTKNLQLPVEAEPGLFLALGKYEMNKGSLEIALNFITKALELNPIEKQALVARSKCYILLGQPENGLKDAEAALAIDKNFIKAIYQKAESLYYLANFEHSLMYYHRGLRLRPDHEGFKLGVHKAQKAIENAIGSPTFPGIPTISSKGSTQISTKDDGNEEKLSTPDFDKTKSSCVVTATSKGSQRTTPVSKPKTAKKSKLLRELGVDKDYLDSLVNNPHIKCKYKEDDTAILNCVKEAVEYLNARQEFWRQQLPPNLK